MVKLGEKVRCIITGFEGVAVTKLEYLNGCVQFCVKPKSVDGKMHEGEYIDHQQLQVVGDEVKIERSTTGGSNAGAPRSNGMAKN